MASDLQGHLRADTVCRRTDHVDTSPVKYLVLRDAVSTKVNPPASAKRVKILKKSVVELKGPVICRRLNRSHLGTSDSQDFQIELPRPKAHRNGVN